MKSVHRTLVNSQSGCSVLPTRSTKKKKGAKPSNKLFGAKNEGKNQATRPTSPIDSFISPFLPLFSSLLLVLLPIINLLMLYKLHIVTMESTYSNSWIAIPTRCWVTTKHGNVTRNGSFRGSSNNRGHLQSMFSIHCYNTMHIL